jgi:hypothetical protein
MNSAEQTIQEVFKSALLNDSPDLVASLWILDGIPKVFAGDLTLYSRWRQKLAQKLEVDPSEIRITGSAAVGISLHPQKNFRNFGPDSDIDIAVISEHHFNTAWRCLRNLRSKRHGFPPATKQSIQDHVNKYIYWGTIATDKIINILPFGREWSSGLHEMRSVDPTKNRVLKARIYKDFDSLRSYHTNNLSNLRTIELNK